MIVFGYMKNLRSAFDNITRYYGELIRQGTDISAVDSLLEEYHTEYPHDLQYSLTQRYRKEMTIKNLQFSYKSSEKESLTLQNISLKIQS